MDKIIAFLSDLQAKALALLQGEPVRVIVYGAAIVILVVGHVAAFVGYQGLPEVSFDTAVGAATVAAGVLAEFIRRFVFSPATVAKLTAPQTGTLVPSGPEGVGQ